MQASQLRRGLSVDGVRIDRTVPTVINRAPHVRVYFVDGTDRVFRNTADVAVSGYRDPFPAGRPSAKRGGEQRKVRVSDGRWAGEAGGFHIDFVSRTTMYDLGR